MNSSSTEYKRHKAVGLGRPPHPCEIADIIVNVIGHDDYVIDFNTWDIVEGDKIVVKFFFDENWDNHTDRKCAVSIDDRVEVFDLVDDQFIIPRHLVVNCDIRLILRGFFEDPISENKIRPPKYDQPYSEQNKVGYINLDMFDTPIKIGSWYDR